MLGLNLIVLHHETVGKGHSWERISRTSSISSLARSFSNGTIVNNSASRVSSNHDDIGTAWS